MTDSILIPVLTTLVSAFLIFVISRFIRPRLLISDNISKSFAFGEMHYIIKVVNKGIFDIHNLKMNLTLLAKSTPKSIAQPILSMPLIISEKACLLSKKLTNKSTQNFTLISTVEDIEKLIEKSTSLYMIELEIICKHSVTRSEKVLHKRYEYLESQIVPGLFLDGPKFQIDPDIKWI